MTVRIHLSEILGREKMTQSELSKKTGIRPNTINEMYWELIDRINLNHLELICDTLDCEIKDLFEIKHEK